MALVDIILPNFNKGNFLQETIDSILAQSFKDFNLFIIDDNSTDNSIRIIDKYTDSRIKFVKLKKNKGVYFCRNLGMRISKSKYISFIDSDDYWDENKLKNQISFMDNHKYKFTYSDYIPFKSKNNTKMTKEKDKYFGRDEYQNPVIVCSKKNIIGQEKRVLIRKLSQHTIYGELMNTDKFLAA